LDKDKVLEIIVRALRNLREEQGDAEKFEIDLDTPLFGPDATLDSLALVSVIVDVEGDVSSELGRSISLTDDRAISQEVSPFDNVQTLLNYIMTLVNESNE
jgi:acyl carrier protein